MPPPSSQPSWTEHTSRASDKEVLELSGFGDLQEQRRRCQELVRMITCDGNLCLLGQSQSRPDGQRTAVSCVAAAALERSRRDFQRTAESIVRARLERTGLSAILAS
mmetsp:Transcript_12341/g.35329  ORF Transcript_12341/g.35329 Transcript_12341/m.35329 type:complete len:107 (+) Transcript_12341:353-673(+)